MTLHFNRIDLQALLALSPTPCLQLQLRSSKELQEVPLFCSKLMEGIGLGLARHILRHDPQLTVVATSRSPKETQSAILKDQDDESSLSKRLRVLNLDVTKEDTIQTAKEQIEDEFGKGSIKCLFNISGIVSPSQSIAVTLVIPRKDGD